MQEKESHMVANVRCAQITEELLICQLSVNSQFVVQEKHFQEKLFVKFVQIFTSSPTISTAVFIQIADLDLTLLQEELAKHVPTTRESLMTSRYAEDQNVQVEEKSLPSKEAADNVDHMKLLIETTLNVLCQLVDQIIELPKRESVSHAQIITTLIQTQMEKGVSDQTAQPMNITSEMELAELVVSTETHPPIGCNVISLHALI
jgi:hypothetical protein